MCLPWPSPILPPQARNVLLKTAGEHGAVVAKVADFGLSLRMDLTETHLSSVYQVYVCRGEGGSFILPARWRSALSLVPRPA